MTGSGRTVSLRRSRKSWFASESFATSVLASFRDSSFLRRDLDYQCSRATCLSESVLADDLLNLGPEKVAGPAASLSPSELIALGFHLAWGGVFALEVCRRYAVLGQLDNVVEMQKELILLI